MIGDSADRTVLVLSDRDELHATWSRFAAGRDGAGRHIHHDHTDLFYVLEGELTVKLADDEEIAAGAGTLVSIPPMVVHGFRNASDADVKYLNLHAPGCGFIPYMRGLRDGEPIDFDQADPEGVEGLLPPSEITIGGELFTLEGEGQREIAALRHRGAGDLRDRRRAGRSDARAAPAPRPRRVVLRAGGRGGLRHRRRGGRRGNRDLGPGRPPGYCTRSASRPVPRACSPSTRPRRASATSSARSTRPMTRPMRSSAPGSTKGRRDEGARPARRTVPRSAGHLAGAPKPPPGCPTAIARSAAGS